MTILEAEIVSDGVMITFDDHSISYFPADALSKHQARLGAQMFLAHDPSPAPLQVVAERGDEESLEDHEELSGRAITHALAMVSPRTQQNPGGC